MLAAVIAEGVVIALLALLVTGLLRSHADILRALHDIGAGVAPDEPARATHTSTSTGTVATDIAGVDTDGAATAIAVTGTDHDTLLAFLSSGCTTCQPFWEAFNAGVDVPGNARLVVVTQTHESESRIRELAGDGLVVVASDEAWESYDVPGSPHFVYVDGATGRITGEGTGPDWASVRNLLGQAVDDSAARAHGVRQVQDVEWRDNPTRVDAELLAAGIGAGHTSLSSPPDAGH
jgi:hypothetical protein